jgi:hypothetical protein
VLVFNGLLLERRRATGAAWGGGARDRAQDSSVPDTGIDALEGGPGGRRRSPTEWWDLRAPPTLVGEERSTAMAKNRDEGEKLEKGDKVAWSSHGGRAEGKVEKKITERTEAAGRTVDASPDDPQYQVRSDRSGRSAVHKPSALKKK